MQCRIGRAGQRGKGQREWQANKHYSVNGFTLIELSIVLVIIGFIVGGVLVGRDLITAATARAQITQIEKVQQAAATFRSKYGYLPGDITSNEATKFGFIHGSCSSDGNGSVYPYFEGYLFWLDLSTAKMVDFSSRFLTSGSCNFANTVITSQTQLGLYLPRAKVRDKDFLNVWSLEGIQSYTFYDVTSTFISVSPLSMIDGTGGSCGFVNGYCGSNGDGMEVRVAYNIDKKIDDGLPQYGQVQAFFNDSLSLTWSGNNFIGDSESDSSPVHAGGGGVATSASVDTCYDNGGVANAIEQYSTRYNKGTGANCPLSFKLQVR